MLSDVEEKIVNLISGSGSLAVELEDLQLSQYRQVIVGMNRIIYEVRKPMIYIHLICDVRRELLQVLEQLILR